MSDHIPEESENSSLVWPKILSVYAILFAGLAPAVLTTVGLFNGAVSVLAVLNIASSVAIVYLGVRVFWGDYSQVELFGLLVGLNYLGLTFFNFWYWREFPPESRAAQMAIPRMIRGVIFASVYIGYFSNLSSSMKRSTPKDTTENDHSQTQSEIFKTEE